MQSYEKIPESADVYFAGDLYFQVAAVPFPASINLSFHLAFCFFFFPSQDLQFLVSLRAMASVVSLFQVWLVLQAAGPLSSSLPSSFLCMSQQLRSWETFGKGGSDVYLLFVTLHQSPCEGFWLVSSPQYSWEGISVPCYALCNFWLSRQLCIVSLLGYVRISVLAEGVWERRHRNAVPDIFHIVSTVTTSTFPSRL